MMQTGGNWRVKPDTALPVYVVTSPKANEANTGGTVLAETATTTLGICLSPTSLQHQSIELIPDCLEHVFSYLTTADKGRVAQVSRLWKETCYRPSVWKGGVARLSLPRTTENVLRSISRRGIRKVHVCGHCNNLEPVTRLLDSLQSLSVSGCYYTSDEAMLRAFLAELPHLSELDFSFCTSITDLGLSRAIEMSPQLESLILRGGSSVHLNNATKDCLKQCKKLRTLDLSGCKQVCLASFRGLFDSDGISKLTSLSLQDCDHIADECLVYIGECLKHLELLDLSFCISITNEGLKSIAKGLCSLKVLKLQAVDNITSHGIGWICSKCVRLRYLDIAFCEWVDDDCIESIADGRVLNSLEELDLSCANITDTGLRMLAENLLCLKQLKIGQCRRLSDAGLSFIASHLYHLVSIDLYGCGFSAEAIQSLRDSLSHLVRVNNSIIYTG